MRRSIYSVAAVAGATGVSAVALKFLPSPFCWIGFAWAAAGFAIALWSPRWIRYPVAIASLVPLAFALGELVLAIKIPDVDREVLPQMYRDDPLLGWKLKPSQVSRATARIGREIIYDVSYSIDAAGHRISPPDRGDRIEGCLFFFTDSFVLGEGVGDHETYPYRVGVKTLRRFRVVNFGAGGYGAEHMLAAIERGELGDNAPCEPTHIFYLALLPAHILRAAGKTAYSIRSPRYQLGANGIPEYLGTNLRQPDTAVDSGIGWQWRERLTGQLLKSRIYRVWKGRPPQATEADVDLYFAIVAEAFRLSRHRWPKAELHLISWDIQEVYSDGKAGFRKRLKTIDAKVHFIYDILPGYSKDPVKYGLHRLDRHPNPLAHEILSSYLTERVLTPTLPANH